MEASYETLVAHTCEALGIARSVVRDRALPLCREPAELVPVGHDIAGRESRLAPTAAAAWHPMRAAAESDGIVLQLVSAFRSLRLASRST